VKLVVCDDDRQVRAAVRMVAEQRGHEIIGECATSLEAIELLRGRRADAAIVDLALSGGTGHEVLVAAAELGLPVIVFSAFVNDVNPAAYTNRPLLVAKPDFNELEVALNLAAHRGSSAPGERRRSGAKSAGVAAPNREEAPEFYGALNGAWPGDVLLALRLEGEDEGSLAALATTVRGVVRGPDRVLRRTGEVLALLLGGTPEARQSVVDRIAEQWASLPGRPPMEVRSVTVAADEAPSDAFMRLKEAGEFQPVTSRQPA
jgi:CheY-like chemotaxis protein